MVQKAIDVHGLTSGTLMLRANLNLKDDKAVEAKADIEQALGMIPKSTGLHLLASEIYAKLNEAQKAQEQQQMAKALNPHIFDENTLWY